MKPKNTDPALKDQFDKAKAFITLEQYDKARAILRTIDHPKAQEWLANLDKIAPEQPVQSSMRAANLDKVAPEKTVQSKTRGRVVAGCLSLVVVCGVLFILVPPRSPADATKTAVATDVTSEVAAAVTNTSGETATATPNPTITETATPSPTITETATSTPTPLPTSTPSPEERIKAIADDVLGVGKVERVSVLDVGEPKIIAMDFPMFEGFSGYEVDYTGRRMLDVVCALRDAGYGDYRIQLSGMINLVNRATGQQSRDDGLTIQVEPGTSANWDCSNTIMMDAEFAVDDYSLNPVFQ